MVYTHLYSLSYLCTSELIQSTTNTKWVQGCYADNYATAPNNGQAYQIAKCDTQVIRGGSAKSSAADLASYKRSHERPEIYNEHLGFRVVMEL